VLNPKERLGSQDTGGKYTSLRNHEFFAGLDWESLGKATPPPIYPYFHSTESTGNYRVPDHLEPGLDDRQLTRLLGKYFILVFFPSRKYNGKIVNANNPN
jgi:3-phosphoinositide dependent protein kinase-1